MSKNLYEICKHCGKKIHELNPGGYWVHDGPWVYCENVGINGRGPINQKRFAEPKTKDDYIKEFIQCSQ